MNEQQVSYIIGYKKRRYGFYKDKNFATYQYFSEKWGTKPWKCGTRSWCSAPVAEPLLELRKTPENHFDCCRFIRNVTTAAAFLSLTRKTFLASSLKWVKWLKTMLINRFHMIFYIDFVCNSHGTTALCSVVSLLSKKMLIYVIICYILYVIPLILVVLPAMSLLSFSFLSLACCCNTWISPLWDNKGNLI